MVLGAHALPPVITVKNLRTKTGPAYRWTVSSRVKSPFSGPLYPGQTGMAKVTVDVQRSSASKGYVVSGKLLITNPHKNTDSITVTAVKARFDPLVPLLTPLPKQLDCPQMTLLPGNLMSCNFKFDLSSKVVTSLTPLIVLKNLPEMQGEALNLKWIDEEEETPSGSKHDEETASCALIQNQLVTAELDSLATLHTTEEFADTLTTGLEVCNETTSLTYDVQVVSQHVGYLLSSRACLEA